FIVLMVTEEGERIPLTIADVDKQENTITLIFQEVGLTTTLLGRLDKGDLLYALVGPLGKPTEIYKYGKVIIVGGGVGIAEIYPVIKALKNEDNYIISILGARTKDLLILEKEIKNLSDEFYVATDDGSYGQKGYVTDILKDLLNKNFSTTEYQLIYAVGPIPMMKNIATLTKPYNIKTIVSLNALMVDATGMCGCCRVTVGGETKFSCVDGPEFDAHLIDWEELAKRNNVYWDKENHICKLLLKLEK
ncbi:MAG: sulfide/dihydroorotate dehydrogenase-like FAD/NAD-binding protein, partial [Candidatus Omnitrophica bacterium]|nr:sulfide/dihydroorotate dehydrogenase-like FAD/NAD-binding protein [Candidatus Omnitrophota bacterium]